MTPEENPVLSVTELTAQIQGMLGTTFEDVFVQGEISQPRTPRSGHVYLTLKDDGAVLPAVIWRSTVGRLRYEPEEGLEVIARGGIDVYPPHGRYQLIIRSLEPVGAGALQLAFEQLRARLEAEGLFAPERKRELPAMPQRIALVTSKTGAAVRDMVSVIQRRLPGVTILLRNVRVQGDGAAQEIAAALDLVDARGDVDVIVVGRGGGSIEDLWAFNEEVVARAIARCETPVVSAVGHETDITIADLVADLRAATPSQAGELVVPDGLALLERLDVLGDRLVRGMRRRLDRGWQQVEALGDRPVMRDPAGLLTRRREALRHLERRLDAASPRALLARRREHLPELGRRLHQAALRAAELRDVRLRGLEAQLRALSPLSVLRRGYSLTEVVEAEGALRVVRSAQDVAVGDALRTRLASGAQVDSRVESVTPADEEVE